jgi:hypothetical protein
MRRLSIILILFVVSIAGAANNFATDSACKALWKFEDGALTTDSKGTNTWSNTGCAADTSNYREGAASVDVEAGDTMTIADGSLDAGFPLKNGDTNKKISVCLWIRPDVLPAAWAEYSIYEKGLSSNTTRSFVVSITRVDGGATTRVSMRIGYNSGGSFEQKIASTPALTANQWYHVGVTFEDSSKAYLIRVYDYTAATAYTASGTTTNNINVATGVLSLSSAAQYDGRVDELVVFNDILSAAEIDQIRGGTYGGASSGYRRRIVQPIINGS